MTTTPPPSQPVTGGTAYQPSPVDPYANKAITTAVIAILTVFVQLAASDWNISFDQEGITALGGAIATVLVYFISNFKRRGV